MTPFLYQCTTCGKLYHRDEVRYLCPDCAKDYRPGIPLVGVLLAQFDYVAIRKRFKQANPDWSLLTRAALNKVDSFTDGSMHWQEREQIGFAYRPVDQDVWNMLLRYEHKVDSWSGVLSATLPPVNALTDIVSAHLNYQPNRRDVVSARIAAKQTSNTSDGVNSSLVYSRVSLDPGHALINRKKISGNHGFAIESIR